MSEIITVKRLFSDAKIPVRHSEGAAAYDLYAYEDTVVAPNERKVIATGVRITVPLSCQGTIYSRSGLALKYCIEICGVNIGPGETKDIVVDIYNHGKMPFNVAKGDRIAQIVFIKLFGGDLHEVSELSDTKRGSCGWGSTGIS